MVTSRIPIFTGLNAEVIGKFLAEFDSFKRLTVSLGSAIRLLSTLYVFIFVNAIIGLINKRYKLVFISY